MSAAWFSTRPEPDPPVSLLRLGALSGFALRTPWLCHLSYHRLSAMNYVVRAASPSWHVLPLIPVPEKQHRSFSWNGLHTIITTINMPLLVIWVWSPWQLIHLSLWAGGGGDSPADLAPSSLSVVIYRREGREGWQWRGREMCRVWDESEALGSRNGNKRSPSCWIRWD